MSGEGKQKENQSGHLGVGGRIKEPPAPELVNTAFAHEVGDGPLIYHDMSLADLAFIVMLCEEHLIPLPAQKPLLQGLLKLHAIPPEDFPYDPAYGDVYTNREQKLRELVGSGHDGWLRVGRARRESSTVGYVIASRGKLLDLAGTLIGLLRTLIEVAEKHAETLMPDYTYLQKAHPTTLAHYLLTFAYPVQRDLRRLVSAFAHMNISPAGGGSVNGTPLAVKRERVAKLLGFYGVTVHTRDAMWQPDVAIEALSAATTLMVNLDRLAEDLYIFATEEFGYVTLADAHSRTSVIMPQKKNPYSLAFVRGAARQMPAFLQTAITTNMTPSGQPDNRIFAYGDVPRALDLAARVTALMAGALARAEWHTETMRRRAGEGFSGATDLGDLLSSLDDSIDPRTAHQIIGLAIRTAVERDDSRQIITAADLNTAAETVLGRSLGMSESDVAKTQEPARLVQARQGLGGASKESLGGMLESLRSALAQFAQWQTETQANIDQAEAGVVDLARRLAE